MKKYSEINKTLKTYFRSSYLDAIKYGDVKSLKYFHTKLLFRFEKGEADEYFKMAVKYNNYVSANFIIENTVVNVSFDNNIALKTASTQNNIMIAKMILDHPTFRMSTNLTDYIENKRVRRLVNINKLIKCSEK